MNLDNKKNLKNDHLPHWNVGSLPNAQQGFPLYSCLPLSSKNQHFKIPIRSGMNTWTHINEFLRTHKCFTGKWITIIAIYRCFTVCVVLCLSLCLLHTCKSVLSSLILSFLVSLLFLLQNLAKLSSRTQMFFMNSLSP